MFGKRIHLFHVFGFGVGVDSSWFLLAIFLTWTLATGYFPTAAPGLSSTLYWILGAVSAAGLFASVVLHELAHSVVARRFGIEMRGITLFIFGGVAEMTDEPPSPKAELAVAIAGPIASIGIAGVCWAAQQLAAGAGPQAGPALAVAGYLALINAVLAIFNMVPAFPLDGGRVLRAILWHLRSNYRRATRITSRIGAGFGMLLILLGLLSALMGNLVGGVWWFLIGLFLRGAASMSYRQVLLRQALEGEPVRRFMKEDPVSVPRYLLVRELVESFVYRHHFKMFPVVDGDRLVGCVTTREIKALDRDDWERQSVGAIAQTCGPHNTVAPEDDAMAALGRMNRSGASRLMVVDEGRLVGVLALKDLLAFFAAKLELEPEEASDGDAP